MKSEFIRKEDELAIEMEEYSTKLLVTSKGIIELGCDFVNEAKLSVDNAREIVIVLGRFIRENSRDEA